MNTQKWLISGIIGGIIAFLSGYLIWGLFLMNYMNNHPGYAGNIGRGANMVWWALILGNLFLGLTLSYIFNKWAGISTLAGGAIAGAVLGLLISLFVDLSYYGTSTIFSLHSMAADVIGNILQFALTGAAVGWANSWGKKD